MKQDLCALLRGNPYPGRGIVLGRTADGKSSVAVYFIMGRSANSRNRIFAEEPEQVALEGDIDTLTAAVWESLDDDNKISLFVRFTDLETHTFQQRIVNKYNS